jgi:hypothetical protein
LPGVALAKPGAEGHATPQFNMVTREVKQRDHATQLAIEN